MDAWHQLQFVVLGCLHIQALQGSFSRICGVASWLCSLDQNSTSRMRTRRCLKTILRRGFASQQGAHCGLCLYCANRGNPLLRVHARPQIRSCGPRGMRFFCAGRPYPGPACLPRQTVSPGNRQHCAIDWMSSRGRLRFLLLKVSSSVSNVRRHFLRTPRVADGFSQPL